MSRADQARETAKKAASKRSNYQRFVSAWNTVWDRRDGDEDAFAGMSAKPHAWPLAAHLMSRPISIKARILVLPIRSLALPQ